MKKQASKRKPARAKAPTAAKEKPKKSVPQRTNSGGPGGAREGAGRKKGAATVKTRDIADQYMKSGKKTPLEYMLEIMTSDDADLFQLEKDGTIDTATRVQMQAKREARRDWAAEKAAPFLHPRLQATTLKGEGEDGAIPVNLAIRFV